MKKTLFFVGILISSLHFGQSAMVVKTDDGKQVVLESNGTWHYSDSTENKAEQSKDFCNLEDIDEVAARKNKYIKASESRLSDLKKFVSVDQECDIKNIKVIAASEQIGSGVYNVCACNKKVKYQKMGSVFMRSGQSPF